MEPVLLTSQHYFSLCDTDNKGYVTRNDIQNLRNEIPFSLKELKTVFELLDKDQNGHLSLEEFQSGFEEFLSQRHRGDEEEKETEMDDKEMKMEMDEKRDEDEIGISNLERQLLCRLDGSDLERSSFFENTFSFKDYLADLSCLYNDVRRETMRENKALMSKIKSQERLILKLTREMESFVDLENQQKVFEEVEVEERKHNRDFERILKDKDEEICDLTLSYGLLSSQFSESQRAVDDLTREKNDKQTELEELSNSLISKSSENLRLSNSLAALRQSLVDKNKERALSALSVSQSIALEREALVAELNALKESHIQLLDQVDIEEKKSSSFKGEPSTHQKTQKEKEEKKDFLFTSSLTIFSCDEPYSEYKASQVSSDKNERDKKLREERERERENETRNRVFKVILIGDSSVGKSSIVRRYCSGVHSSSISTVGIDVTSKILKLDEQRIILQFWDTAGQERYRSLTKQYFRKSDAVILVYDITDEKSFLHGRSWLNDVTNTLGDKVPILILGNKNDLAFHEKFRKITRSNGSTLAYGHNGLFEEVSAKTGMGIESSITKLVERLVKKEDEELEFALKLTLENSIETKKSCC